MITLLGYIFALIISLIIGVHIYRYVVLNKTFKPKSRIPFDGEIFKLGDIVVARRRRIESEGEGGAENVSKTIVCMPGFMETISYFFDVYKDENAELILVNNCAYHSPIDDAMGKTPSWFDANNPYLPGTIEHDAFVFAQIVDQLATTDNVVLHGHSRGGAVILEASKLISKEKRHVAAILEAPVLPQGKARGHQMPKLLRIVMKYYMPLAFHYYRHNALAYLQFGGYRYPATDVKEKIISDYFSNPKQYKVTVTNISNIDQWAASTGFDIYNNFSDVTVLVPENDIVLDRELMYSSAAAGKHVKVVEVQAADHFISLERPEFIIDYIECLFDPTKKLVNDGPEWVTQ